MPLQIVQVRNDLLSKLGIEDAALAPALALQDVVVAINGAMQELQRAGQEFFTKEQITVNLVAGTPSYTIVKTVQAILGDGLLNGLTPLRGLSSKGELLQFDRIFLGGTDYGAAAGTPIAYWADNRRSGTTGDINEIHLYVVPVPNATGTLTLDVVNDAPAYDVAALSAATELPVAQNYTESVFLPIARMLVTRSSQFSRPDLLDQLTEDFGRAMQRLGTAGGFPNVVQPEPERQTQG